jgi:putative hydrolase of the HAD superfamily
MMKTPEVSTLFLDIGGVLLTNGWDRHMRRAAADEFNLDYEEMNERHHLTFDTYEEGKLSLSDYLQRVVFFEKRSFAQDNFKDFMFAQSKPKDEMIDLIKSLKERHGLKVAAISNEGRELTIHRVRKFNLGSFIDFFISSCFVHFRKPDVDIFRLAFDCAQVPADEVFYIDDRALFVEVAAGLGIRGIQHTGFERTRAALGELGLILEL